MTESKAYKYCEWILEDENEQVGIYVKKQAQEWKNIVDGISEEAYVDVGMYEKVCGILKLLVHPDLLCSVYDGLERYQWFFITAILCTKRRIDDSRYYETGLLEISRKNFKTFTSAIVFIVEMLVEPKFSRFYSVAPDYKLSSELRVAVRKIVKSSPLIEKYFKVKRDMVECKLTDIEYTPLAYSNDKMDGKLAHLFLADEAGAMDDYPVEAMRSSQITLKSKLGIIISTQYPNYENVFRVEVDYAKKVLDGYIPNKRYFSLLYEPNEELISEWQTNDLVIYQSNPVAVDNEVVFNAILDKRIMAIMYESKRENYLCKHNNIMYKGVGVETYISSDQIKVCDVPDEYDWSGRDVYLGIDMAETWDNSSICMLAYDETTATIYSKCWCFIQEDYIEEKCKKEKINYREEIEEGNVIVAGESVLDYRQFEDFIIGLPEKYKVNIVQIGYDIRNARNTAQKLENEYYIPCVEVRQHSSILHPIIKLLKEKVLQKQFLFSNNLIYQQNFTNCRCKEDSNLNKYINKKTSSEQAGKIDMVFATLNALYVMNEQLLLSSMMSWTVMS